MAGKSPGFVRTSKADPHYFAFDSGRGFFPIGHNYPIYDTSGQIGDAAMRRFAAAGENYNRWWMSSSGFGIEWADRLGWYRQDTASRLDAMLDLAEKLGLYYMICMDTHQDFREEGWLRNPFNADNGGPCKTPGDWFTNATAKELYKKRLRYTVARWGYSPHVFCWEFGNEFEGWDQSPDAIKLPWHEEMSDHLRAIDPFRHLITTSFWSNTGPEAFWKLRTSTSSKPTATRTTTATWPRRSAATRCTSGSGSPSRTCSASSASAATRAPPTRTPRAGASTTRFGPG